MKTSLSSLVVAVLGLLHLVQLMPVTDVPAAKVEENFLKEAMTDGFIVQNPFASTTPQRQAESPTLDPQDGQHADMSEASGAAPEGSGDYSASTDDLRGPGLLHPTTAAANTTALPASQEEGSSEASGHSGFGLPRSGELGSADDLFIDDMATTSTTTAEILSITQDPSITTQDPSTTTQDPSTTTQSPSSTTTGAMDGNVLGVASVHHDQDLSPLSPPQSITTTTSSTTSSTTTETILPDSSGIKANSNVSIGTLSEIFQEGPNEREGAAANSSSWMIILGFVVGVAALVLICIAVATRDSWNGPSRSTVQAESNGHPKEQQPHEQEMEVFLPTEARGGAEYTAVQISELCEKESMS